MHFIIAALGAKPKMNKGPGAFKSLSVKKNNSRFLCLYHYYILKFYQILPGYYKFIPPETSILCPLIQAASALHKNATTPPISLACPTLPNGLNDAKN